MERIILHGEASLKQSPKAREFSRLFSGLVRGAPRQVTIEYEYNMTKGQVKKMNDVGCKVIMKDQDGAYYYLDFDGNGELIRKYVGE